MGCGSSRLAIKQAEGEGSAAVCDEECVSSSHTMSADRNGAVALEQRAAKRSRSSGAEATATAAAAVAAAAAAGDASVNALQQLVLQPEQSLGSSSMDSLGSDADGATLWVGNIPDSLLQESDGIKKVEAELRRVFFSHGVATAVSVRKKDAGANKSWAFVTFASADSVQKAVRTDNFVTCADGTYEKLTVKVADVQAQMKKRAATPDHRSPPAGAMEKMWNAQNRQVLQGLRTPMQDILEALHNIAATVPSVAGQIEHVTTMLTSTEDLWSIHQAGSGTGDGKNLASGSFRDVEDEDVKSYLRSHQNLQLQESHAYSQELMQRRYREKGRRMAVLPDQVLDESQLDQPVDASARILRVVPEISDEARIELVKWESKIDSWDFDIFRVSELTNGAPLAFVMFAVFSRYNLLNKLQLQER